MQMILEDNWQIQQLIKHVHSASRRYQAVQNYHLRLPVLYHIRIILNYLKLFFFLSKWIRSRIQGERIRN
uniref:Uncharacterized protein n=1 Tax=Daphnia magna TaxID=35525 RepID=A0A0P6D901_9CRUS